VTEIGDAVTEDEGGWNFACSRAGCGADGGAFSSTGWTTRKAASDRGRQHFAEHDGEGVAQELADFRNDQYRKESN
jgi:hypothetical protein